MRPIDYSIHYSRFHDDSDAHAETMAGGLRNLLASHLPGKRDSAILDVGCGYGFALRALRGLGYTALKGLEISPQQAERGRGTGFDVEIVVDTATWLHAHPSCYDCVLLLDVLEHVPMAAQIDLLHAILVALKPGGRIVLTTPNANSILASRWRYIDYTHHGSFTEHSLYFVLKNAGFESIMIDASKGIGRMPRRLWRRDMRLAWRKWFVRWCWLQVHKAEIPWEKIEHISFELNLLAVAEKAAAGPGPDK